MKKQRIAGLYDYITEDKPVDIRKAAMPTDKEVQEWWDLNIGDYTASASSSIYKYRLWIKERIEAL